MESFLRHATFDAQYWLTVFSQIFTMSSKLCHGYLKHIKTVQSKHARYANYVY
jgi:hypothetical protein